MEEAVEGELSGYDYKDEQSFQNRGSWMVKGGGHLNERDTAYDNPSRIEPKRSHQWFTDANEPELFPNKKQAVQAPTTKSTTGILDPDPRPSVNASNFFPSVPSQFMDRLFGGETNRPFNFTEQSVSSVAGVDSNMMRKGINEQFGNDSSVSLSISHTMEDPEICLSYGGFRKVNSNQVKNSDSGFHAPEEHHSGIGQVYNPGNETNFMSSGKGYTKEDESVALMGHTYKGNANIRSVGYAFEKGDDNSLSIGQSYDKGGFNGLSFGGFQQEPVFNPLARPLNSYEMIYDQSSVQTSETPNRGEIVVAPTAGAVVNVSQEAKPKPRRVSVPKNKSEEKVAKKEKEEPNSFPYNVKTLIMTGMLDGMPVKYISPSGQSFQNKGSWMAKGGGHLTDGDAAYDNPSRVEPKRSHQWFADANEPELFPNKKQAVQTPNGKSTAGILNGNPPPLGTASSFLPSVPSQFMDRLFGGETDRPFDFTEQNISSVGTDDSSMRKNCVNNQHGNDSSVSLSISNAIEDPEICLSYGGVRKINGYQIKDSDSGFHVTEEHNRGSDQAYNQGNETDYISMGKGYSKEDESVMLMGHTYKGNSNIRSMGYGFEKGDDSNISIGHGYNKEGFNALSFGSFQEEEPDIDPLARPLSSYEFTFDQSSVQISETPNGPNINEVDASTAIALPVSKVAKPRPDSTSKNKSEQKVTRKEKEAPNSFPWNVKTLISTGILDGVPVKYIAVSREVLNAHEYERHAGCKTKHPNNHIYFENGKSTYQVVQELRSIPETQLYDAIQTATGSPINQKAFLTWKESFQAATRELQRIYGKEDLHS
ncbi:hypothetical protein RHSIM_Rhsim01G0224700 [Rhododendron simsii]|uniref:Tify domain-containing protein n=1 Tax=Rhododendron simsii TaxID=118357 RepID=A0A834HFC1_RHOSS|nr:hypothetical protein RHSIM_Rhsim01G0224700 [Rhododendron simsii]